MKVSELPFLRDEWYAVARADDVRNPLPVRLLGDEFVLWTPAGGSPVLFDAYCPHRGAHLAAGSVRGSCLQCCYHGWEFGADGAATLVPQLEDGVPIPPRARVATYPVVERYGLLWACVGTPGTPGPPPWPEADELGWRVQVDFFEPWAASALRIIDNTIDQSHPAFVHEGTFGDPTQPRVPPYEVTATDLGFVARITHGVRGAGPQVGIGDENVRLDRVSEVELLDTVHTRILLAYGGRVPDYCFYGSATPIDDEHSLYVRISALAGDEEVQPYGMFYDYSRRVTIEDKVVLETTHPDFAVDVTSEVHLRCDRTTIAYRRHLAHRLTGATDRDAAPEPIGALT